ncbi:MAG: undecaprenyl/decaprenyl-phosphate alpha-N-acetylglucosaminyl 1-phosphate transferase [Bacteroidales bacterium]|jgi:UDP-N-acetylmuramyl pentapeptide phosphotransferase/UDP-N-acetylglucosamine-1-phosphate transferase|nr:undecaprenyl/decaprenyl-phosphate alpha-N-acetylglucosaminyl 1-phosphate transferase [Bacteroidales bacterium]
MRNISAETLLILAGAVSFFVTYYSIPSIVTIARLKKVFDEPKQRKSHVNPIPTLGGVSIFAGFTVSAGSFISYDHIPSLQYILVACIIIFFIGLKDDLLVIAPSKKLLGQIVAALILILSGDLYLTSLHSFLGISHVSFPVSIILTTFVIIVVVNSFNLIDGVDGLAASIGMLTSAFFGTWFFLSGNREYSLISAAVFGTLLAFFRFNVFGGKNKIFMGDTGSLLVGLLLSVQVILFNEKNIGYTSAFHIMSAPAVSFAVLIVPLYDTIRVFIVRILRRRSPFSADKNHIHHLLLKLGYTHVQTTMLIAVVNICFIFLALLLQGLGIIWLMLVILILALALSSFLEYKVRLTHHNEK